MKTIQNLKTEFNQEIKKTKIEIKLNVKNSGYKTKTSEVSLTKKIKRHGRKHFRAWRQGRRNENLKVNVRHF